MIVTFLPTQIMCLPVSPLRTMSPAAIVQVLFLSLFSLPPSFPPSLSVFLSAGHRGRRDDPQALGPPDHPRSLSLSLSLFFSLVNVTLYAFAYGSQHRTCPVGKILRCCYSSFANHARQESCCLALDIFAYENGPLRQHKKFTTSHAYAVSMFTSQRFALCTM